MKTFFRIFKFFLLLRAMDGPVLMGLSSSEELYLEKTIQSTKLGTSIDLLVTLPAGYHSSEETYPVVYYLDSRVARGFVNDLLDHATRAGWSPKLITVGIDSQGENRSYYLTPTRRGPHSYFEYPEEKTGGGPLFLTCIQDEIIPWVEAEFRTIAEGRTLLGHSLGGLFSLYTLLQKNQPFENIIASSPSLTWDNRVLLDLERKFHASNRILPVYLYVAAGSLEELPQDPMVSNLKAFIRQLETRDYDRFNLAYQINKNDDHLTNKYVTYTRGVRWVFHEMDSDGSSANALPSEVWRQYLVPFLIIVAVAAVALAGLWQARGLLGKSNS